MRFSSLRSRCSTPIPCMWSTEPSSCHMKRLHSFSVSVCLRSTSAKSSSVQSSRKMTYSSRRRAAPYTAITCSWLACFVIATSRSIRSRFIFLRETHLAATYVFVCLSSARKVVPKPPEPSLTSSSMWKRRKMPVSEPHSLLLTELPISGGAAAPPPAPPPPPPPSPPRRQRRPPRPATRTRARARQPHPRAASPRGEGAGRAICRRGRRGAAHGVSPRRAPRRCTRARWARGRSRGERQTARAAARRQPAAPPPSPRRCRRPTTCGGGVASSESAGAGTGRAVARLLLSQR
mmetsp:Transcript_29888/g.97446  ORF Transcript_29888/g.97446 Transcript_29888/m.97446 type:complete len:292 (-) Transcript_29888:614-1489(-)